MSMILAMAGLGFAFNSNDHAERSIDALPAGWYVAQIVNSEVKPTKTPGGARLNLQFKILSGDFAGRVVFGGYNIQNQNPVAVQIAMEELAELSRAVGKPIWNDTQELHAIPFNLKLKVRKQEGYNENNEPQQYKAMSDMAGVVYATKADMPKGPATFGGNAPQAPQGFGQPQMQQPAQSVQPGWAAPQQPQQVQQPVQQPQQQQPVNNQPQQGNVNFTQAAQAQPWGQNTQTQQATQQATQQQPVQQPQQTAQQPEQQEQPVQQPQVEQ